MLLLSTIARLLEGEIYISLNIVALLAVVGDGPDLSIYGFKDRYFKDLNCYLDEVVPFWNLAVQDRNEHGFAVMAFTYGIDQYWTIDET